MIAPKRLLPAIPALILLLLSAISDVAHGGGSARGQGDQPLKAIPELFGTRYCYGDAEIYSVWLRLRVKYVNQTNKILILDREIGKAWYGEKVARNLEELAAGKYEYNPNNDWFFSDKDKLPVRPSLDSPGADFVFLAPGETFQSELNTGVVAQYESPKNFVGSIGKGTHVLELELSAWNHPGEVSEFEKSWRKFGQLVSGTIKTEPLEIRIPSNPKVEKNCK
jgi:hypothetical protein